MSTALLAGRLGAAPAGAPGQPPLPLADTRFPPRPPPGRLLAPAGREAPCAAAGAWPAPGACAGASAMSGGRGRACGAGGGAPPAPPGRSAAAKGVGAPWEGFSASSPGGRGWRAAPWRPGRARAGPPRRAPAPTQRPWRCALRSARHRCRAAPAWAGPRHRRAAGARAGRAGRPAAAASAPRRRGRHRQRRRPRRGAAARPRCARAQTG